MTSGINDSVIDSGGVLIVGAGLAGLFTALKLNRPVTVLSAAPLGAGASSVWAQGGVAAALACLMAARTPTLARSRSRA
jgi:L-aspartate oxidase